MSFVAEVKSRVSLDCKHTTTASGRLYHTNTLDQNDIKNVEHLQNIQETIIRCKHLLQESHDLCVLKASEVLVFILGDLDRTYKPEIPHAYPIAYALRGYSMKSEVLRQMIKDVIYVLFQKGMYTPVVAYDGQWSKLAFQTSGGKPLTLLELQRKIYNDIKAKPKSELLRIVFQPGIIKATDAEGNVHYNVTYYQGDKPDIVYACYNGDVKPYRTSCKIAELLKEPMASHNQHEPVGSKDSEGLDEILSNVPGELISNLNPEDVFNMQDVNDSNISLNQTSREIITDLTSMFEDTSLPKTTDDEERSMEAEDNTDVVPVSLLTATNINDRYVSSLDMTKLLQTLKESKQRTPKFTNMAEKDFESLLQTTDSIDSKMTKNDVVLCLDTLITLKADLKMHFCRSWVKRRLVELLHMTVIATSLPTFEPTKKNKIRRIPDTLVSLCRKKIRKFPKSVLNAVVSEHVFDDEYRAWQKSSPFAAEMNIDGTDSIIWFSKQEYNEQTLSYVFSFLDLHHLITNCRVKVCKDGFVERGISKQAWIAVARDNSTNLRISHVEDLVDKQSDSIARETFSKDVELCMKRKGYIVESDFCKLVREFYEAEDEPGLSASERYQRRINFRNWLLHSVQFNVFPPYGTYIRSIPHVMFQGFLTNIDRRIRIRFSLCEMRQIQCSFSWQLRG